MSIDLTQNYYELFGLPKLFLVNQKELAEKYRQIQRELHPDRYAGKSASEQRLSVQFTSLVNGAYQTLKSPLLSAEYLLQLAGHPVNADNLTIKDGGFLFKQMEWREELSDLSNELSEGRVDYLKANKHLDKLRSDVVLMRKQFIDDFKKKYEDKFYEQAKQTVAKLHFVEKMLVNIDHLEDELIV